MEYFKVKVYNRTADVSCIEEFYNHIYSVLHCCPFQGFVFDHIPQGETNSCPHILLLLQVLVDFWFPYLAHIV